MNALRLAVVALGLLAFAACKGESEPAPSDPRPPAPAPAQDPSRQAEPAPAPTEAPAGEQAEAPAEGEGAPEETAAVEVSPAAQQEADQLWTSLCSTCHGANGEGDGPVAAGFPTKPRSFKDKEWQANTTDENIAKVIVEGGPAIGLSPLMPGNPNLKDKPEVVQALVNRIRELGK